MITPSLRAIKLLQSHARSCVARIAPRHIATVVQCYDDPASDSKENCGRELAHRVWAAAGRDVEDEWRRDEERRTKVTDRQTAG